MIMENIENYGKFESADALLSAYNALETEFTKRCQLIKQLQAELETLRTHCDAQPIDDGGADIDVCAANAQADGVSGAESRPAEQEAASEVIAQVRSGDCDTALSDDDILNAIVADAARFAALLTDIPQIMDACVARYKEKLIGFADASPVLCGRAVLTPAKKPRTLADAKRLADELLSGK